MRFSPSMMTRCDSKSASVSGELSSLRCTANARVVDLHDGGTCARDDGHQCVGQGGKISHRGIIRTCKHRSAVDWKAVDTVLLDMDGTLLDLRFDNWFWLTLVPSRYAAAHGISEADAQAVWRPSFKTSRALCSGTASSIGRGNCSSTSPP